jgi:hypothetical protein
MKLKTKFALVLFVIVAVVSILFLRKQNSISREKTALATDLKLLGNFEPKTLEVQRELIQGSLERQLLFEVRSAYDNFDVSAKVDAETYIAFSKLAEGLRSSNNIVRETTGDMVRHILTRWVRRRDDLRSHPEINAFFKAYSAGKFAALQQFLKAYPESPESKYLNEI